MLSQSPLQAAECLRTWKASWARIRTSAAASTERAAVLWVGCIDWRQWQRPKRAPVSLCSTYYLYHTILQYTRYRREHFVLMWVLASVFRYKLDLSMLYNTMVMWSNVWSMKNTRDRNMGEQFSRVCQFHHALVECCIRTIASLQRTVGCCLVGSVVDFLRNTRSLGICKIEKIWTLRVATAIASGVFVRVV